MSHYSITTPSKTEPAIYGLLCPDTLALRYVGYAKNPHKRYLQHCSHSNNLDGNKRCKWLSKLILNGKAPVYVLIEQGFQDWCEAEKRWISFFRSQGADLVNTADGGVCSKYLQEYPKSNGKRGHRPALANMLSETTRSYKKGYVSKEVVERIRGIIAKAKKSGKYQYFEAAYEMRNGNIYNFPDMIDVLRLDYYEKSRKTRNDARGRFQSARTLPIALATRYVREENKSC